jgi:hypothetical protein
MGAIKRRTSRIRWDIVAAVAGVIPSVFMSCSRGPQRVEQPDISPSSAGGLAVEQYDTNGNNLVDGAELDMAPGLKAALPRLDTNHDNAVSADEVAARVEQWQFMRTGLISFNFKVTLDGTPLQDATVTFEPESFLGEEIKPASCTTNMFGGGGATIAKEDRPSPTHPPGMHLGLYKVKVSKIVAGKETIPLRYNRETILGQELAPDVPEIGNNRVAYALTTR